MRVCKNCDGNLFSWDSHFVTQIPALGSGIPRPTMFLACEECSEIAVRMELDEVASFLTKIQWKISP